MVATLPDLADAHIAHLEEEWDAFARLEDEAREDLRRGIAANLEELCSLLRSDVAPSALMTPVGALDYARRMRAQGLRLRSLEAAYHHSMAMTRGVASELVERIGDIDERPRATRQIDDLLWAFVARAVSRLGDGYGERPGPLPDPADRMVAGSPGEGLRFVAQAGVAEAQQAARAAAHCGAIMDRFHASIELAARSRAAARLANADTTTSVVLADEPDLAVTLLLDREPIEVVSGALAGAEAELRIPSVDLKHIWYPEFHLPMAIVRGRITTRGTPRKFLRVLPVLRGAVIDDRAQPALA